MMPKYHGQKQPAFSNGWLENFKKRRRIGEYKYYRNAAFAQVEDAKERMDEIRMLVRLYDSRDVYSMDETGLQWKLTPNRTLATASQHGRKQEKARVTVVLCVNADGSDKLNLTLIGTSAAPRCFRNAHVKADSLPARWASNKTAWMTTELMLDWLLYFDAHAAPRQVLLLLDKFSAHEAAFRFLQEEAQKHQPLRHVRVEWLPPNVTSHYQPLDQGIIHAWKAHWRRRWLRFMINEVEQGRDPQKTTHVLNTLRWAAGAWQDVKQSTITNCWQLSTLFGASFDPPTQAEQDALDKEVQELESLDEDLRRQMAVLVPNRDDRLSVSFFLSPMEENVDDSEAASLEHAAETFSRDSVARDAESSEDEDAGKTEPVTLEGALLAIQTIQRYLEQQPKEQEGCVYHVLHRLQQSFEAKQQQRQSR